MIEKHDKALASLDTQLGPLEQRVLSALWERPNSTARDILNYLGFDLAYTTVATTIRRLATKGLAVYIPDGRRFRYTARFNLAEFNQMRAKQLLRLGTSSAVALADFVEAIGELDPTLLDELHRLVEQKQRGASDRNRPQKTPPR